MIANPVNQIQRRQNLEKALYRRHGGTTKNRLKGRFIKKKHVDNYDIITSVQLAVTIY